MTRGGGVRGGGVGGVGAGVGVRGAISIAIRVEGAASSWLLGGGEACKEPSKISCSAMASANATIKRTR